MSGADIFGLLPDVIIAGASILILLMIAARRNYNLAFIFAACGIAAAFASLFLIPDSTRVSDLLVVDSYSKFFIGLVLAANLCVLVFSYRFLYRYPENREEFFLLLLLETLGAIVLTEAVHFVSFFLGIELLSVSLYALLAYLRNRDTSIESGLKYLVPAATASALFLFGMALMFRVTGTMGFGRLGAAFSDSSTTNPLFFVGLILVVVGVGFKLSLVPFHMWAADVYQGAGIPATASIATVSKVGVFAMLYRLFAGFDLIAHPTVLWVLTIIGVLSMLGGNLLALRQRNLKRMLAYSSTAHLGYLMVPFLAGGTHGLTASSFYLLAYSATSLGLFGAMSVVSDYKYEAESVESYAGLAWRRPGLAIVMVSMLLSLAGIPLTAGFMGKVYLLTSGVGSALWLLAGTLVLSSGIGLFYYLRVVALQFARIGAATLVVTEVGTMASRAGTMTTIVLSALVLIVIALGVYPAPVVSALSAILPAT